MATRRFYRKEARYKDIARNEAAEMQDRMSALTLWLADHPGCDEGLRLLFNRKIDLMLEYHDLCTEIINYKKEE